MGCGVSRDRRRVAEVSQRLTRNPTTTLKLHMNKCTMHTVTSQEIRFLSKLFGDLSSRSGGLAVDKTTFMQFFPLPVRAI